MTRIFCILLLLPAMAWADTYKCVDQGKVIYSSSPCGKNAELLHFHDDQAIARGKLTVRISPDHNYQTPGTINGHPVTLLIDTGATRTAISQKVAEAAGVNLCSGANYAATASGTVLTCLVTVGEITFGDFHIKNLTVAILPNLHVDALLGMDVLGRMKLQQEDGVLYISHD